MTPPRTAEDLRATPEGSLRFPRAEVLEERGADEGEGSGFDQLDLSAFAETFFRAEANWAAIVDWYGEQLVARGWESSTSLDRGPELDWRHYVKPPRAEFWIRRLAPGTGLWTPTGAFDRPGTVYATMYKVRPAPTTTT